MTSIEDYIILEIIKADFSKEVFPEESNIFSNLRSLIKNHSIIVNSFSRRKFISSLILILLGAINYPLLYNSGVIHIATYINYYYFVSIFPLILGLLMFLYNHFSSREFFIMSYMNWFFFGEKTKILSFQRFNFIRSEKIKLRKFHLEIQK